MRITNNFSEEQISSLAQKIWGTIRNEPMLTNRTYSEIENALRKKNIYIMYEQESIVGFIGKRNLDGKWCELISLYIYPRYRNRGYGRRLLKKPHVDNNYYYIIGTFQEYVALVLKDQGFRH